MSAPCSVAIAAANCDSVGLRQLISEGEDVNLMSTDGNYPLAIAAFWGYADIVKILLENGADINSQNTGTLWTPLHCAAFQGHGKVILKLTEFNPDFYAQDNEGRTPIDFASALDSIWPIFAAAGFKRTPKAELTRMDIIRKAIPNNPAVETSHVTRSVSAGEPQFKDPNREYAFTNGDVLASVE